MPAYVPDQNDGDLLRGCCAGDQRAWQALVQRYDTFIERQILRTFRLDFFQPDEEDARLVRDAVIDILLDRSRLAAIEDPSRFQAWLARVCRNKAHDHVRRRKNMKRAPEESARLSAVSLHASVGHDSPRTIADTVGSHHAGPGDDVPERVARVCRAIDRLEPTYRLPLKLQLVFSFDLLDNRDYHEIATSRGSTPSDIRRETVDLCGGLVMKQEETVRREATLRIHSACLERLQTRRCALAGQGLDATAALHEIDEQIARHEKTREALLSRGDPPIVPSNREIGTILGLPERTVATRLFRARALLRKALGMEKEENFALHTSDT